MDIYEGKMVSDNPQEILSSDWTARFISNFRKVSFHLTNAGAQKSSIAKRMLDKFIIKGSNPGQIAGDLAFYAMGKILYGRPTISMGGLTKELLIPPTTTNRLVAWWVDNGLAERLSDPNDKRVVLVRMTDHGKKFHETTEEIAVRRIRSYFAEFTSEEAILLNLLLEKLSQRLENGPAEWIDDDATA